MTDILYRFKVRGGTASALASVNETPRVRELIAATDARNFKLGDGGTAFNDLAWLLVPWTTASGTDTITATYTDKPVLFDGMAVRLRAAGANTGAVTFNPNGLGALAVTRDGGTALLAGEIAGAGHELLLVYRSSVPRWELLNPKRAILAANIPIVDAGGYFPTDNVESALQALGLAGGGGGSTTFTATVAGSAVTTFSLSGLDLDAAGQYEIEVSLKNATASSTSVGATFNADTTASNYDSIFARITSASGISSARADTARIMDMAAVSGARTVARGWLTKDISGVPRIVLTSSFGETTSLLWSLAAVNWVTAGTNVTGITLTATVANSLDIGSTITARTKA